ncbi:hypothetical protein CROQUDRAFT_657595 [Cronartium quercuum f. sp. fusiforme G11]|uniref:Uncharacterized protein n=1 Tax=Cronartium quercuum f. sp. fusiforme G11 TaxID=708437 RepID=A0A9P6NMP0_9BASI|nr:hypothetical protein CROQUDRAFT_657595 [Cronartium quercuum f. sp. fusiforme G11]
MVHTRSKNYDRDEQSKEASSSEDERNSSPERSDVPQITTPTQSTSRILPQPQTPSSLATISPSLSIPRTPQISSFQLSRTMSDTVLEWKSITFRSRIPTIVKNSGAQLLSDGSNYREWEFKIRNLINDYTVRGWWQ